MNRIMPFIAVLFLSLSFASCKKTPVPEEEYLYENLPGTLEIVGTSMTRVGHYDYIEAVFEDETKMYFRLYDMMNLRVVKNPYSSDGGQLEYKGDIIIPGYVTCDGKKYMVSGIGKEAFKDCVELTSIAFPKSVKTINESAFENCAGLKSVAFTNVEVIERNAFRSCTSLKEIEFPASLRRMSDYAFAGCTGITSVVVPYIERNHLWNGIFSGCLGLTSVEIQGPEVPEKSFSGCVNLISVKLSDSLVAIGRSAFSDCKNLTSIDIPPTVSFIQDDAFKGCEGLTSVNLPDSLYYLSGFSNCKNLVAIDIPNKVRRIGPDAFRSCENLEEVSFSNSLERIESYAFAGCDKITAVELPALLRYIGDYAFASCDSLVSFTCHAENPPRIDYWSTFSGTSCDFYVPKHWIDDYKEDAKWRKYANRIYPIAE